LQPTVLLPGALARSLAPQELAALLGHELAHLRHHDLVWCTGWRWMKSLCWFHPLVWNIPAAHSLACEQEADRMASAQLEHRGSYAQLLARLALQVLALPAVETCLTANGTSQIARRLDHLQRKGLGPWKIRHSVAGFGLALVLLVVAGGWEFTNISAADARPQATTAMKEVLVLVQDDVGTPVEGATIQPDGLRVKGPNRLSHHGWNPDVYGAPAKVTTDRDGKARVKYPVLAFPAEKQPTGEISFSVVHPDFCRARPTEYPVDGTAGPIRLTHGARLEVSGYVGRDRQPVSELVANVSGGRAEDWQQQANGNLALPQLPPGGHLLQLMGRLPSGQIGYSESHAFTAEPGKPYAAALELKPGVRLEGRLDERVPRPVKNGRVLISVRPKELPAWLIPEDTRELFAKYGIFACWRTYRPIAANGTFVFESIPPGEVDVVVHGEGFVSRNGGQPQNRINSQLVPGPTIGVPQPFPLAAPVTTIVVVTEPTATLEVTARTKSGKPVGAANVYLYPNVLRMGGVLGLMTHSSEEPLRTLAPLPEPPYSGRTDATGRVTIHDLPAVARHLDVDHPEFEVAIDGPRGDRTTRLELSPGATTQLELTLQPKGKQFLGSRK
jgi:hypothetical protein